MDSTPNNSYTYHGGIRFDDFMEYALYDLKRGYYTRNIKTVGPDGDFSTSATISPILGEALAESAKKYFKRERTPWNIIECGAGSGSLAHSILKNFSFFQRRNVNYHIVETSPVLSMTQQAKLGTKATWHKTPAEALEACKGVAYCFSNELVDAFPTRVFKIQEGIWKELFIKKTAQGFTEDFLVSKSLPDSSIFSQNFPDKQRVEVHESYQTWLQQTLKHLKKGQWVTIDYGDYVDKLYYRRPHGTLRAYAHHQRTEGSGVYQNPGYQDITSDVNFTDLQNWGEHCNLETVTFKNQRDYLQPYIKDKRGEFLTAKDGAGEAFKLLVQERK